MQTTKKNFNIKHINFFSKTLNPQKSQFFGLGKQDDMIFTMASQIRNKLTSRTYKNNLYSLQKNQRAFDIENEQTQVSSINKVEKPNLKDLEKQKRLLSQITIHRISNQRQNLQNQTKLMQNKFNYLLKKHQESKKKTHQKQLLQQRLTSINRQQKFTKQILTKQRQQRSYHNELQNSRLRQQVLFQKIRKQKSLAKVYQQRFSQAKRVRQQSQQVQIEILNQQQNIQENNRNQYYIKKKEEKARLLKRQQIIESKKIHAQMQFKEKWLNQFSRNTKARNVYLKKQQVLDRKLSYLMQELTQNEQDNPNQTINWSQPKNNQSRNGNRFFQ